VVLKGRTREKYFFKNRIKGKENVKEKGITE